MNLDLVLITGMSGSGKSVALHASGVSRLDDDSRAREIARMLGGEKVSQTSLAHAREMLGHKTPATAP